MEPVKQPSGGYERSDARLKPIVVFTLILTATVLASFWAMTLVFDVFQARSARVDQVPHPMAQPIEPPGPRLQRETSADLVAHRERERMLTTRYEWVDRTSGVVRIPVERAMELTLERGLPTRQAGK